MEVSAQRHIPAALLSQQKGVKPKIRKRKLRIGNWQGVLKQKSVKTNGHKTRAACST
jgi:thiamine phosphate synthase YjbQ (UPF0047 family)